MMRIVTHAYKFARRTKEEKVVERRRKEFSDKKKRILKVCRLSMKCKKKFNPETDHPEDAPEITKKVIRLQRIDFLLQETF